MAEGTDTSTKLPSLLEGLKKSARDIEVDGEKLAVESLPISGSA